MNELADSLFCSPDDVIAAAERLGFLPFFKGTLPGLSIEEHTPDSLWFSSEQDGPWEWKGPIVRSAMVAYAKILGKKAVYVSPTWLPHIVNLRRATRTLSYDEQRVLNAIVANENMLSTEIRDQCGFPSHGAKAAERQLFARLNGNDAPRASLDSVLSSLQMAGQIVVADFEYNIDKKGRPYGWGIARYSTPEILYADWFELPNASPDESRQKIKEQLLSICPQASTKLIDRLLK